MEFVVKIGLGALWLLLSSPFVGGREMRGADGTLGS